MKHRLYAAPVNDGEAAFTGAEMREIARLKANILGVYASAPDTVRAEGAAWYTGKAAALAQAIADDCDGVDFIKAAAVVAVMSPSTRWSQQVATTAEFCRHVTRGGSLHSAPKASLYFSSMEKAAAILLWDDMAQLRGPKVEPFFRNIVGDFTVVTLDVWAVRVALGHDASGREIGRWTAGRPRKMMEAAYHLAAADAGDSVAAVQAVTWIMVRGTGD